MTIENNRLIKVENKDIPKSGEFIIPDNITEICHDAFRECFSLVKVKIPYGIKKIEDFLCYLIYSHILNYVVFL